MRLYPEKFKTDENRSNPMAVALQYTECPINEICFYLVTGFGKITKTCKHIIIDSDKNAECIYEK